MLALPFAFTDVSAMSQQCIKDPNLQHYFSEVGCRSEASVGLPYTAYKEPEAQLLTIVIAAHIKVVTLTIHSPQNELNPFLQTVEMPAVLLITQSTVQHYSCTSTLLVLLTMFTSH